MYHSNRIDTATALADLYFKIEVILRKMHCLPYHRTNRI
jgi:hypothetical protein